MDPQLIKSLIDALAASNLAELEYSAGGETLRLVKAAAKGVRPVPNPTAAPEAAAIRNPDPVPVPSDGLTVEAPLHGVVHLRRNPDAPLLAAPGHTVAEGQVLCLIEAMKVFTELRAERGGTLAAVLVQSGQEVEAGQPLFRIA